MCLIRVFIWEARGLRVGRGNARLRMPLGKWEREGEVLQPRLLSQLTRYQKTPSVVAAALVTTGASSAALAHPSSWISAWQLSPPSGLCSNVSKQTLALLACSTLQHPLPHPPALLSPCPALFFSTTRITSQHSLFCILSVSPKDVSSPRGGTYLLPKVFAHGRCSGD